MTTKDAGPDPLVEAIGHLAFEVMGVMTRLAGELDLSLTQMRVIGILRDRRLRMVELANYLGLEKSTMTGLVTRAEKRGLLARAPNPHDRRSVDVFLTEAGRELLTAGSGNLARALGPLLLRLSPGERATLHDLVRRMLAERGPGHL